jgi:hypothetical protein
LKKHHHYGNVHAIKKSRQSIEIWYATSEYLQQEIKGLSRTYTEVLMVILKYHRTECDKMRYNAIETKTEGTSYLLLTVKAKPFYSKLKNSE